MHDPRHARLAVAKPHALLEHILQSRREAWEKAELDRMQARGITPTDDSWKQKYNEPSAPDTTDMLELPAGWVWASSDQLTTKITSGSRDWKDYYDRGSSVFVMAQNVRPRRLDLNEIQYVDPPAGNRDARRSEVAEHDLLITIVGANTGDVCRVPEPVSKHYVCQSVALARPVISTMSVFVELYLCAVKGGQAQFAKDLYGAGRPHLSFDQLRTTVIPLPPPEEQSAICEALNIIEADIDAASRSVGTTSSSAARLRQAVLRAALSGRLVPQEPSDEPASALLERIAAERPLKMPVPKRDRRKGTATT